MEKYAIITKKRYDSSLYLEMEILGETAAIRAAHNLYRERTLNRVLVVDMDLKQVFTIERRCKCTRVQRMFTDDFNETLYVCDECGASYSDEEYVEEEERVLV